MWPDGARSNAVLRALSLLLLCRTFRDRMNKLASHPFQRQRYALADADAHGGEREPAAAPFQAVHGGEREARARHAERMAERDRPAMGVDVLGVVGESELAQAG